MSLLLKKTFIALSFVPWIILLTSFTPLHEFYVSLTEIRFNSDSERFEVSLRVFPDDMDRALEEHYGISSNLVTELEHPEADSLLENYLLDLFRIESDGVPIQLSFLGKEAEADVMWCYFESERTVKPAEIAVFNALLCEIFEEQVNIIQVYVDQWNSGLLLKREKPRGLLKRPD